MMGTGLWLLFSVLTLILVPSDCATDQSDVSALNNLYVALHSAPQLVGWTSNGGDPCGDLWKGITCSGFRVTDVKLSGLGLTGSLGYKLDRLTSVIILDLSNNNIGVGKQLPYQLPPNVKWLDLSGNSFGGEIPYSLSKISSLMYLNVGRNQLHGSLPDKFRNLPNLSAVDLSDNKFSGDLPHSFSMLSSLTSLYLQNNQFTGTIDVLANLPLRNLNVANNRFTGWIPDRLKSINNLRSDGNSWNSGPSPPSPAHAPKSPQQEPNPVVNPNNYSRKSGLNSEAIAGVIISVLLVGFLLTFLLVKYIQKRRRSSLKERFELYQRFSSSASSFQTKAFKFIQASTEIQPVDNLPVCLKPPPCDQKQQLHDTHDILKEPDVKSEPPINTKVYSVADIQTATRSFSNENLVGEGSFGCVYTAEFKDGKVLAVKKVNTSCMSPPKQEPEAFERTVSNISKLNHPNLTKLVGYCSQSGQYLLVYELHTSGSLHDHLHFSDEHRKPLTWSARVNIALGTAHALEYLQEVCIPPVILKNFKSKNILLDEELNPHVSDCGQATLVSDADYQATNLDPQSGYDAPEVVMSGQYTLMSDVYSFGVVLLELLTGRKPFDSSRQRSEKYLVRWATPQLHDIDALGKMVDPTLEGFCSAKSLSRFADVIALCLREPEYRPPLSQVVHQLESLVQLANQRDSC